MVAAHREWLQAIVCVREGSDMSEKFQAGSAARASERVRAGEPEWLRVRMPSKISREWFCLAQSFVQLMCTVLEPRNPRGAILRFRDLEHQGLSITFVVSAQGSVAEEQLTLLSAARNYVELSRLLRLQCLAQEAGVWRPTIILSGQRQLF